MGCSGSSRYTWTDANTKKHKVVCSCIIDGNIGLTPAQQEGALLNTLKALSVSPVGTVASIDVTNFKYACNNIDAYNSEITGQNPTTDINFVLEYLGTSNTYAKETVGELKNVVPGSANSGVISAIKGFVESLITSSDLTSTYADWHIKTASAHIHL